MRTNFRLVLSGIALLGLSACAAAPSHDRYPRSDERHYGQQVDTAVSERDEYITRTIRAQFARDPEVSASDIDIETYRGTVALSGYLDDGAEMQRAVKIALSTPGVRTVRNEMQVGRR
ncbi:MAG: BON domain-containing protein [Steroidobacteraceae bacterium]